MQPGYQKLVGLAEDLLEWARQLLRSLRFKPDLTTFALANVKNGTAPLTTPEAELLGFIVLTEKVCDNARRRVLQGETLANEEKIHSIFEPHTELIKRGKQPNPIEFGHKVLVIEDAAGFVMIIAWSRTACWIRTWSCR